MGHMVAALVGRTRSFKGALWIWTFVEGGAVWRVCYVELDSLLYGEVGGGPVWIVCVFLLRGILRV